MVLIVGCTGLLGCQVCLRIRADGASVRSLARPTANPARFEKLRDAGVEMARGDLKDPPSLSAACKGIDAVISTASSTLSRQPGDSIETVDRQGQFALIQAARDASVNRFTFVGIPRWQA